MHASDRLWEFEHSQHPRNLISSTNYDFTNGVASVLFAFRAESASWQQIPAPLPESVLMNRNSRARRYQCLTLAMLLSIVPLPSVAAQQTNRAVPETTAESILTSRQIQQLDRAVDRGLEFLSRQQRSNGSFECLDAAQPAVTSFCIMAYLSRGHLPGEGPYGEHVSRAISFVLSKQQSDGLLCDIPRRTEEWKLKGSYNHAIAGVMLGEVYGMTDDRWQEPVGKALNRALEFTRREQVRRKRWADDHGGWRYLMQSAAIDSDLSITSWHLMFYRSARNAGFDVSSESIDPALAYVRRCFDRQRGSFSYGLRGYGRNSFSRGMAGAGILSLSLAGDHQSEMAQQAARFVLKHPFNQFNRGGLTREDRYYYGAYYCSQAMFQMGGEYWAQFYPGLLRTLIANQDPDGSWAREANQDGNLGFTYSTSLAILALTPPYQLLPIYQR